jgi:hypothetical protein
MNRSSAFPSAEDARALHARLLGEDVTAGGDVCEVFLAPLIAFLHRCFPREDPDLLQSAVDMALVGYIKQPQKYDPQRHPDPGAYLRMAAKGKAMNLHRDEARHRRTRERVELDTLAGNEGGREGPALRLIRDEQDADARQLIAAVEGQCDPRDSAVLRLLLDDVKAMAAYAAVLGISHLPIEAQEQIVKRAKDRVKKRLGRYKHHA